MTASQADHQRSGFALGLRISSSEFDHHWPDQNTAAPLLLMETALKPIGQKREPFQSAPLWVDQEDGQTTAALV